MPAAAEGTAQGRCQGKGGGGGGGGGPHRKRQLWVVLGACWLAISLLCLVALLHLPGPYDDKGDAHAGHRPYSDRGAGRDAVAVAVDDSMAAVPYGASPCQLSGNCYILCQSTKSYVLNSSISQLLENNKECASELRLEVINVEFPNNSLTADWLGVQAQLSSLTLSDSNIVAFHDDAFSTSQFASLNKLLLSRLTLRQLQAAALRPLRKVEYLSVAGCTTLQEVDPEVMTTLPELKELQVTDTIYSSNRQVLAAFTGGLQTIPIVDFRVNGLGTLQREDLGAAVFATSLYLDNCFIEDVLVGTFPSSPSLEQLFLHNNKLTTLSNMSIDFENRHSLFDIYLAGNPWNCDCSLLWLLPYLTKIADEPLCSTPKYFAKMPLTSALKHLNDSCNDFTTTPASIPDTTNSSTTETSEPNGTTESTTTETAPTSGDATTEQSTHPQPDSSSEFPNSTESSTPDSTSEDTSTTQDGTDSTVPTNTTPTASEHSTTEGCCSTETSTPPHERPDDLKPCIHIGLSDQGVVERWTRDSVHIEDVDEFTLKISVPYSAAGGFISWKGSDSPDCYEMSPLSSPSVELKDLKPEVDYNVCVLRPEETRTSLYNCHPHRTMAEYSKRTWISNGDRPVTVSMTALGSVVLAMLSALGAVLLLWLRPNLIWQDFCKEHNKPLTDRRRPPPRELSPTPETPPAVPPRPKSPSQSSSHSSNSYITVVPSPLEGIALSLGLSVNTVKHMLERRDRLHRPYSWSPSTSSSPSEFYPRSSISGSSTDTVSTIANW